MSVYRTSLLAFASLLPIALALPAAAANDAKTGFVILGKDGDPKDPKAIAYRDIGGLNIGAQRCQWYNWHQSISLWPVYVTCDGKSSIEVRKAYHETGEPNGFSKNAKNLIAAQAANHTSIFNVPGTHIKFHIGGNDREALPCAWFNYIQSRIRTPLYVACGTKDNQASYGMYSAPNFLKGFTAPGSIAQEQAYDASASGKLAPVVLNENDFYTSIPKLLGTQKLTLNRCEWSNFFQSISFLPRFVACKKFTATVGENSQQLKNYEKKGNLNKIKFDFGDDGSSQYGAEFNKFLTLKVGTTDVTATVCEWYNLVQSEARWPIYRTCLTKTFDNNYKAKTIAGPGADRLVRHKLLYSN
jgi:hypothetical protein